MNIKTIILSSIAFLGSISLFAQKAKSNQHYGDNIIRISPLSIVDIGGAGFGVSYERIVGNEKNIGLVFPFYIMMEENNSYSPYSTNNNNVYFYMNPGVKFYVTGQRKVSYSVGPSLLLGFGNLQEWTSDWNGNSRYVEKSIFRLGILVNNYLNFQVSDHINVGLELGIGMRYLDREKVTNILGGAVRTNHGFSPTGQFGFTMGYRF